MRFLIFIYLLVAMESLAQTSANYDSLSKKAWQLYTDKAFLKSAETYQKAFLALGGKGLVNDRYLAACAWAWAGKPDSSFVHLFKITDKGLYTNLSEITSDTKLSPLHNDGRWKKVIDQVKKNKENAEAKLDRQLVAQLDSVYHDDQDGRHQINTVISKGGQQSPETMALWKSIRLKDSLNQIKVMKILDNRGWLGADVVGKEGNSALFLVIQHADISIQEKYLPMMKDAVKKGNAAASSLALLEDRVALRRGGLQTYGSQIGMMPETGEHYVLPLADPDRVNERRKEVGLGSLETYIEHWGMTWDVEAYKKKLPEYIRIQKK